MQSRLNVCILSSLHGLAFKINVESWVDRSLKKPRGRNFGFRTAPRHAKRLGYVRADRAVDFFRQAKRLVSPLLYCKTRITALLS